MKTLSGKSAGAGHRAVSLLRDCVLVFVESLKKMDYCFDSSRLGMTTGKIISTSCVSVFV